MKEWLRKLWEDEARFATVARAASRTLLFLLGELIRSGYWSDGVDARFWEAVGVVISGSALMVPAGQQNPRREPGARTRKTDPPAIAEQKELP